MDPAALWVTIRLATATTAILLLVGIPLAWWLATTKRSYRHLVEAVVTLPLVLPPTVLGFYVLLLTGPKSPLGYTYEQWSGSTLPFSFPGIVLGSVLFNLPFAVRPFTAAFLGIDRRLIEASWCLGETRLATFLRVALPLAWPGIAGGAVLTFAHAVGEFGVVLMVGGSIPSVTRTLSISIYDDVQALDYAAAGRTSLVLVVFALAALCLVNLLSRRATPV